MQHQPGTYVLVMHNTDHRDIQVGSMSRISIVPGYYLYVGSALGPGGLKSRVSRHCRIVKKKHWHIDYLREHLWLESIWYRQTGQRLEHQWARSLSSMESMESMESVNGFGCSDCGCAAHLFYRTKAPKLVLFSSMLQQAIERCVCTDLVSS